MVRTGMGQCINEESISELDLEPILTWYAKIIDIRQVEAGESIGYSEETLNARIEAMVRKIARVEPRLIYRR